MGKFLTGKQLLEVLDNPQLGQDAIVEDFIFKDTINLFYSEPGAGKSVIAVNMMASMSAGWPVFGLFKMKKFVRCSYLQLEGSIDEQLSRLHEMRNEIHIDTDNICWHDTPVYVEDSDSRNELFKELDAAKPEVIFIDSLYCLTTEGLSNEKGFLKVRALLKAIKHHSKATIIILHHSAKPIYHEGEKVDVADPFLGSQYLKALLDMSFFIRRIDDNSVEMKATKGSRNSEAVKRVVLNFNKSNWIVSADAEGTTIPANMIIKDFIRAEFQKGKVLTTGEISKKLNYTKRHILRLKKDGYFNNLVNFIEHSGKETQWTKK